MRRCVDRAVLREADPPLELQLVEIRFDTGTHETYQLLVDGGLDALDDPRQVRELVHMIRAGATLPAERGHRRVRRRSRGSPGSGRSCARRARSAPSSRTRRSSSTRS